MSCDKILSAVNAVHYLLCECYNYSIAKHLLIDRELLIDKLRSPDSSKQLLAKLPRRRCNSDIREWTIPSIFMRGDAMGLA